MALIDRSPIDSVHHGNTRNDRAADKRRPARTRYVWGQLDIRPKNPEQEFVHHRTFVSWIRIVASTVDVTKSFDFGATPKRPIGFLAVETKNNSKLLTLRVASLRLEFLFVAPTCAMENAG